MQCVVCELPAGLCTHPCRMSVTRAVDPTSWSTPSHCLTPTLSHGPPPGNPCDASVQEILYWQAQTMRMMYGLIAGALKEAGSAALPTDYLQFFFVGQREPMGAGEVGCA